MKHQNQDKDLQSAVDAMLHRKNERPVRLSFPEQKTSKPITIVKNDVPAPEVDVVRVEPTKRAEPTITSRRENNQPSPFVLNLKELEMQKAKKNRLATLFSNQVKETLNSAEKPTVKMPKRKVTSNVVTRNEVPYSKKTRETDQLPASPEWKRGERVTSYAQPVPATPPAFNDQFTTDGYSLPPNWHKGVLAFAAICLLVILPIKGFHLVRAMMDTRDEAVTNAQNAVADLTAAGKLISSDPAAADKEFAAAKMNFTAAQGSIAEIDGVIGKVLSLMPQSGKQLDAAKRLATGGEYIAELGQRMTAIFNDIYTAKDKKTLTEKLHIAKAALTELRPLVDTIADQLAPVDATTLPEEYQATFTQGRDSLLLLQQQYPVLIEQTDMLATLLGDRETRRYLFMFQNNNELRPSGGFLGSLALVDMHHGEIVNITMPGGGSYDFQGSLKKLVKAPLPLQLVNPRWELQDTNWFMDFPTTAQQVEAFMQSAGGPSVDGVIAINATAVQDLLAYTQPIAMPAYNKVITKDNFITETQYAVEKEYDKIENKPKQFLADLAPLFIAQIFDQNKTDLQGVVHSLSTSLTSRDIQIYMQHPDEQAAMVQGDWAGAVKQTSKDYLAVIHANVAGGKTDGVIKNEITHTSEIKADGSIIDTVTLTRTHNGDVRDPFTGVRNNDFVQFVVPQGSILLTANGFDQPELHYFSVPEEYLTDDPTLTQNEANKQVHAASSTLMYNTPDKTVFGNWITTDPQKSSTVTISYQLPYTLTQPTRSWWQKVVSPDAPSMFYSLFYQKQSGANNTTLTSHLIVNDSFTINSTYPNTITTTGTEAMSSAPFTKDVFAGFMISGK